MSQPNNESSRYIHNVADLDWLARKEYILKTIEMVLDKLKQVEDKLINLDKKVDKNSYIIGIVTGVAFSLIQIFIQELLPN